MPERRAFLARALALAAAGFLSPLPVAAASRGRLRAYPFTLGVASGSPEPNGVVLWTRLAPEPLDGGGMGEDSHAVRWEIAHDERFARIVRSGTATAAASRAHAVHVEADGLEPGRWYHYRFLADGEASPVGRTRTAPAAADAEAGLRLALASCQHFEQGYFVAHRHLAAESPDLVAFAGDYIYERNRREGRVRRHEGDEPRTLEAYRRRYAQYRGDADLQAAHACAPWLLTWDDHEVANDYAGERGQDLDPGFAARRAAAYRAWLEHQPVRPSVLRDDGEMRLYGGHAWGAQARILVLDGRQYRDPQACPRAGRGGSNTVGDACGERTRADRTLLGSAQEAWLDGEFAASRARWNLILQSTLMVPAARRTGRGTRYWTDGWDGYPAARARLLASLARSGATNPVVLGGDVHANYVADLRADPGRADSPVLAAEFCGTSITSKGPDPGLVRGIREANPDIRHADGTKRGYVLLDIGRERLEATLRVLDSVKRTDAEVSTAAAFRVEAGRPGVVGPL